MIHDASMKMKELRTYVHNMNLLQFAYDNTQHTGYHAQDGLEAQDAFIAIIGGMGD